MNAEALSTKKWAHFSHRGVAETKTTMGLFGVVGCTAGGLWIFGLCCSSDNYLAFYLFILENGKH